MLSENDKQQVFNNFMDGLVFSVGFICLGLLIISMLGVGFFCALAPK